MKGNGWLLALYAIPGAFLAMYADTVWGVAAGYPILLLSMAGLGYWCRKRNCPRIVVLGNAVSLMVSLGLLSFFREDWQVQFKPFSVWGMAVVLSCACWILQYLVWYVKRERDTAQNFLFAVCATAVGFGALVLAFLILQAKAFGAL